jgi:hypothetical protein
MSLHIPIHIRIMVAMQAQMCRCPSDGVGEAIITTITMATTAAFAMMGEAYPIVKTKMSEN